MKYFWIIATGFILTAGIAQAQQLTVRSGDHPTFSRLTIPLPTTQPWEAVKTEQGIELTLPDFSRGFDTSDVFTRMRPNRIVSLNAENETLTLRVDCACDATVFRAGSLLVIDVADAGTDLAGPPVEGPALTGNTLPSTEEKTRFVRPALPWIGGPSPFGDTTREKDQTSETTPEVTPGANLEKRAAVLREIQKNLTERVASAASVGLLENSYKEPLLVTQPSDETVQLGKIEPQEMPEQMKEIPQNIRITSSMDSPNGASYSGLRVTTAEITCPDDRKLAIETWGDDSGFSAQVGSSRNALMDSRDRLDPDAAKKLAQVYIYFGFGAEALDALHLDPTLAADNPEMAAVATILERGDIFRPNALSNFADCNSNIALWATLSFSSIPSETLVNTNAALRALNNLPKHLRQVVAPALSDRYLKYGDAAAAAAAMRSIERLGGPLTYDAMMSQAALALDAGKPAEAYLEKVIDSNSTQSPDALVRLVEEKLAKDEPLSTETATLVEAYVQELRGTKMGYKLRQTQVIALGQLKRFDEAFDALDALGPSLSPEANMNLRQTLFELLTKHADDVEFLEHTFALKMKEFDVLSVSTRMQMAARLQDLGFAAQVQKIIATFDTSPRIQDRQLLAARAALSLRQPYQAQAALIGVEGPDAELLLAKAKEMTGDYREASRLFSDNNAQGEAAQAAWLSEDWRDMTPRDIPSLDAAAALARASPGYESLDLGLLGRANRILEESSAARDTLEQLLRDPIVQIAPDS